MSPRADRRVVRFQKAVRAAFEAQVARPGEPASAFIEQAAASAFPGELPELSADQLGAALAEFWRFGAERLGEAPKIRLRRLEAAPALDWLEVVQPDRPFLVDSIMGELAEHGFSVRAMFHPVVDMGRGARRSLITVVLDRVGADREAGLLAGIRATVDDVAVAVRDFPAMLALMSRTIESLETQLPEGAHEEEQIAFLRWLHAEHFVFLGARVYDYPRVKDGGYAPEEPRFDPAESLGVLRDPERVVLRRTNEPAVISARLKRRLAEPAVSIAKANLQSRVHRRANMDYVAVKRFDEGRRPCGEIRFVGLFTAEAYDRSVRDVPLIRAKAAKVLEKAGSKPSSHSGNRLRNIVENLPRDELFQGSADELLAIAEGVLHLYDRPRVRLFERLDPYERFVSVLLYVPRDRYNSTVRIRAGERLAQAYSGRVSAYYPYFSEGHLARVHFIIGLDPGQALRPDLAALEHEIAEIARTWEDRFEAAVRDLGLPSAEVSRILSRCSGAFPAGYRERYSAQEALLDLSVIDSLAEGEAVRVRAFRAASDAPTQFRFKLYRPGAAAPLAEVLPILENMGLKAMVDFGHEVCLGGDVHVWVHEFEIDDPLGERLVFADVKAAFEDAFVAVWTGRTENDRFNRLVLALSIAWRDAALVRALARYRQQSGLDPTEPVQARAVAEHAEVTELILALFRARFDPAAGADLEARRRESQALTARIDAALQGVPSLDDDRVLRRLARLVGAIQRTNFYQRDAAGRPKPYISFKVASGELAELPAPKPYREIFVWATHVEGVHLRFGPVARGGLRWSDRRDDFRTEVLGLAKAQQVKNAVIVPVGAKGGFYPKQLPRGAPEAVRAEAVRAYETFLDGLLDVTDNLTPQGGVVPPPDVVVHDGEDPYLVVAADKGTATFSDIANALAERRGFWLGDAFASGGSAGYDHKAMGITARGAWEAVKRHFRELGKDIQAEPFTVIGVGDMSGDVFGNGMLLSRQTRLLAAFDHRHVFIDPDPDPARSYAERERLFGLPRSSWDDYDRGAISPGGGVFARTLKSIPLPREARAALEVDAAELAPDELIRAILKAPAELLYLGGIGTYVKAAHESHADVGDKANDAVRVDAGALGCLVVGEGANLGVTQAARVAFALAGGRIDTDAIHNSGGVDSSDHEVNIKILTGMLERTGVIARKARDRLLRSMTGELAQHVLQHNYDQTLALSLLELDAPGELRSHARFMTELEAAGRLDRALEGLPDAQAIDERERAGHGLTRPEYAVLLAYGKLELSRALAACEAIDDADFEPVLEGYFPKPLRRYGEAIRRHRLRREIIATVLANDVVNRCGPTFAMRLMAAAGADVADFIRGYHAAKAVLDVPATWEGVAALDGKVAPGAQLSLFRELAAALRGQTFWLARRAGRERLTSGELVERYAGPVRTLRRLMPDILSPHERAGLLAARDRMAGSGAPGPLAREVTLTRALTTAADLVDLSLESGWPLANVARIYHAAGALFGFDRLRAAAGSHTGGDYYERSAVRRLLEDLLIEQAAVTGEIMAQAQDAIAGESALKSQAAAESWRQRRGQTAEAALRALAEMEADGTGWSFAKLTIAHGLLRELAPPQRPGRPRRKKG